MHDLFRLQDELSGRIVRSLLLPLTDREQRILRHDKPASPRAYEYYLRANQVSALRTVSNMALARDLYLQALDGDPEYAPAWARIGRTYRFLEKFGEAAEDNRARAAEAFRKVFELNADLPIAHGLYGQLECDQGRAVPAMLKLLERARFRRNDPDLFTGLVQACRYCDELPASVAAHERAKQLDRQVATSVAHTYFLLGDYRKTLDCYGKPGFYLDCAALAAMGEDATALTTLRDREKAGGATGIVQAAMQSLRAYLEGDVRQCIQAAEHGEALARGDPEMLFYIGRHLARAGEVERAIAVIGSSLERGFLCWSTLVRDPWLHAMQKSPSFVQLIRKAEEQRKEVHGAFVAAGGGSTLSDTQADAFPTRMMDSAVSPAE